MNAENNTVWWEGESAIETNFPRAHPENDKGAEVLSEGMWLYSGRTDEALWAEYDIQVPADGSYDLYVRKCWKHGPFRWRFDDGEWREVTRDVALLDSETLREHTPANWVHAGRMNARAGRSRVRIEADASEGLAAFDAFLLTDGPFFPRGKLKPGEPYPGAAEGWFVFNQYDTVLDPSPIDLRTLNEAEAGAGGRIGVKGNDFVQNGRRIRFLAVGASPEVISMPRHMIDVQAKFLARKGVNLVRFHGPLVVQSGPNAGAIDESRLDSLFYYVSALRREGIYSHLSIYFQHWFDPSQLEALPGYDGWEHHPFAIHFFNDAWQEMYRGWWKTILTRENPYTGITLAEDAALMSIELLNEDSFFFWTFGYKTIPAPQMEILERKFGAWAAEKHGSATAALEAWGRRLDMDRPEEGRLGFLNLWELFGTQAPRNTDTARFLAETQRAFFDEHERYVKEELGFQGLVVASNWRTANTRYLGALDKWTNHGADFMDHHGYFASWQKKAGQSWHFTVGDMVGDRSLARWDPMEPGSQERQLEMPFLPATFRDRPQMVSEYAWPNLNQCRAEMPLITTALAAQNGLDAMVLFALNSVPAWQPVVDMHHWPILTPAELGQFPAAALTYRLGLVEESKPVATLRINVEEMMNLAGNAFTDPSSGDYNRAEEGRDESKQGIDMRIFAAGPVEIDFSEEEPGSLVARDAAEFDDVQAQALRGATGQIDWRYGDGMFLLQTPSSQGATGFLGSHGDVELGDAVVRMDVPFGAVWLVAMDEEPISRSGKILVQVMSEQRNHGYRTEGELRRRIVDLGTTPVEVRQLAGRISLRRPDAAGMKVTALDVNGVPVGNVGDAGNAAGFDLVPDRIYYLITRP